MENEILTNTQENKDVATVGNENQQVEVKTNETGENGQQTQTDPNAPTTPKSFSQDQVNEIVRNRIDRLYTCYGVKNKQELDDLVGKSQSYDVMKERYGDLQVENANLNEKLTFLENNISPDRYDDVRAYFKGKGIDFSGENLIEALATHPEWLNQPKVETPKTTITTLGNEITYKAREDEKDVASKLFGFSRFAK